MNDLPTTNGTARSSTIYRTLRNYLIKFLIFIQPRHIRYCKLNCGFYYNDKMSNPLKATDDETLFLELACRGSHLSRLKDDDETTAEIVKIG